MGASVMFSSAVMCGNRLKCWNTMPMLERTWRMRFSLAGVTPSASW